nr:MAG TPA: hypothetical protein [Bacteriophage sp.]
MIHVMKLWINIQSKTFYIILILPLVVLSIKNNSKLLENHFLIQQEL